MDNIDVSKSLITSRLVDNILHLKGEHLTISQELLNDLLLGRIDP